MNFNFSTKKDNYLQVDINLEQSLEHSELLTLMMYIDFSYNWHIHVKEDNWNENKTEMCLFWSQFSMSATKMYWDQD